MNTKKSEEMNPFATFDPKNFDFTKMMGNFKMPGVDMEAMMAAQRKNVEALTNANRVAAEGMQAVAKRQAEIMAEAMAQVSELSKQMGNVNNPQEMTAKQAEIAQQLFEKALKDMRELAEMMNKANVNAFEVINTRFNESIEEMRQMMSQIAQKQK